MNFNSLSYFFFLPIVFLVFSLVGDRGRLTTLLVASFVFYGALKVPYLLIALVVITLFSYAVGILLDDCAAERKKRVVFWCGVAGNIVILCTLKYLPFISLNLNKLFGTAIPFEDGLISIGVSYFTFQAISYLTDIYLEIETAERRIGYFALYMAFFPKLLQGPIERAGDLLPQLRKPYQFNYDDVRAGLLLFSWGLFKKIVVADRLGTIVDPVYNNVHSYSGIPLIMATYCYAIQIFCDFSGYTDMALGTARIFNIRLTQNFNAPYLATSIADFWRRWHISFSRWILDYIFKPLQMEWRDRGSWGTAAALVVTFLVSGIWHGASWHFVVWGILHGVLLAASVFYKPIQKRIHTYFGLRKTVLLKFWQVFVTFNLVCLTWIFFRANNLHDAVYVACNLFVNIGAQLASLMENGRLGSLMFLGQNGSDFPILIVFIVVLASGAYLKRRFDIFQLSFWARWPIYYLLVAVILLFGNFAETNQFIYFRF